MGKIQIITDSASDISKEAEQKYNLDVISYSVVIGDQTYTSRVDFDNEGCYKLMEENDGIPMTSQITAFQFMDLYYEYYQKGCTPSANTVALAKAPPDITSYRPSTVVLI